MSFDLMFREANDLYLSGAYKQASDIYLKLLAFAPENADILNMLGLSAQAQGAHEQASSFFYRALKKAHNLPPIYFNLAVSLTALSKFHEAIEAYEHILKQNPDLKEAYNNLGGIYEKLDNPQKALEYYQQALKIDSSYLDALVNIAVLQKDKPGLEKLADLFKTSALPFYHLALFEFDAKNNKRAIELICKADSLEESFDIKNLKAQIYLQANDISEAQKAFHQALILNAQSLDVLINLGQIEKREDYFKKAISLAPHNFEAHITYADFLYQDKRPLEALEEYRQAVLLQPDNPNLSNNMALILKDMADYKGALDLLMNAFIKDKADKAVAINMAETLILLHQKDPQEAKKIARLWQRNAPDNVLANRVIASFNNHDTDTDKAYTQILFDEFADIYDTRMQEIRYNIFNKIKELNIDFNVKVLDLGCGTGLAAENLKTPDGLWTGVDVSKKMLDIAESKGLYHQLYQDDIVHFLEQDKLDYNIILLLDVIEYTKKIETIAKKCFPLKTLLSFEQADDNVKTFELSVQGRYRHNPDYIFDLFQRAGYKKIKKHSLVLRQENGQNVNGFLFVCDTI